MLVFTAFMTAIAMAAITVLIRTRSRLDDCVAENVSIARERDALALETATISTHRSLLVQILNGLGEGLLAVDRERHVVLANPRFAEMFSAPGDLFGRPLSDVARSVAVFNGFDDVLEGREASARFPLRNGVAERKIEIRAFPLHADDISAVALFLDVTQVERLEQIRRDFISDFSHEVRTPLTGLRSAVESFEIGGEFMTAEEDQQLRRIMSRQLARLEGLVNDLSELSRIESGDIPLELREVELSPLVRDLCEDFSERAAQKALRFVVGGCPAPVYADPMRVQQAVSNMIDNAIKYGGVNDTIEIETGMDGESAFVAITDHGEESLQKTRSGSFAGSTAVTRAAHRRSEAAGSGWQSPSTSCFFTTARSRLRARPEQERCSWCDSPRKRLQGVPSNEPDVFR
jgi:two-component system phosphate regulon sensor histidine kinase PhoR